MHNHWEHFEHGADIGVRGFGASQAEAFEQAVNVAMLPGIVGASCVMPDAHWGYGFPIGGEAGVGSTGAIRLNNAQMDAMLSGGAKWAVERGWGSHADLERSEEQGQMLHAKPKYVSEQAKRRQREEMGTLGSGNHYLEVQEVTAVFDDTIAAAYGLQPGDIVVMIHCGSRGLGHQIGTEFLRRTVEAAPGHGLLPAARLPLLYDVSHNTCKQEMHTVDGRPGAQGGAAGAAAVRQGLGRKWRRRLDLVIAGLTRNPGVDAPGSGPGPAPQVRHDNPWSG